MKFDRATVQVRVIQSSVCSEVMVRRQVPSAWIFRMVQAFVKWRRILMYMCAWQHHASFVMNQERKSSCGEVTKHTLQTVLFVFSSCFGNGLCSWTLSCGVILPKFSIQSREALNAANVHCVPPLRLSHGSVYRSCS